MEITSSLSESEEEEEVRRMGMGLDAEEAWEREEQEELLRLPASGLLGNLGRWWWLVILDRRLRLTLGFASIVACPLVMFCASSKMALMVAL